MNLTRKILGIALAIMIAAVSLTGCKTEETANDIDENGNYIVPENQLQLTVWETQGTDYTPVSLAKNDVVAEWLEGKTNVTIEQMYGNDGGQWDSKLTKLVAGDNLPEIIHCGAGQGAAHFSKLNKLNSIWTFDEETIKKYAPDLWARTPEEYWDELKDENGKIMGIPYKVPVTEDSIFYDYTEEEQKYIDHIRNTKIRYETDVTFLSNQAFYVRDDILRDFFPEAKSYDEIIKLLEEKNTYIGDELLDIPIYSTEDYIKFFYGIKNKNYKTDNGKTVYALGYSGGDNWMALSWLGAEMYGYKNHCYSGTWNEKTQKYELMLAGDLVKQAAKTQNQMVADNVIDPESLAHTVNMYKEKVINGQYAVVAVNYIGTPVTLNAELERLGKKYRYRPFITQVPNKTEYPAFKEKTQWGMSIALTKKLDENQVHQVLNWINTQCTDEFLQVRFWGPEEAGLYEVREDGLRYFKDDRFNQYFIYGNTSALPEKEDRMGLDSGGSLMPIYIEGSKWQPSTMHLYSKYIATSNSGFAFSKDSEHVKNVKEFPPTQIWNSAFSEVPEVVTFWSAREQWEAEFKKVFAVSPDQFDQKWQEAVDKLNKIVDIEALEKACTDVVKKNMP